MIIEVTQARLKEIRNLMHQSLGRETATLKQLQSLLGKLKFVAACVKPSRMFVSRMLSWLRLYMGLMLRINIVFRSM